MLPDAVFGKEEMEGGRISCIWKDKQTAGTEVWKGEGEDGDEEGEVVEYKVGMGLVESPRVFSMSLMVGNGVSGGTSSTSTSE